MRSPQRLFCGNSFRLPQSALGLAAAFLLGLSGARAQEIRSAANGFWDAGATWVGGSVPGALNGVVISNTVTIRNTNTHSIASVHILSGGVLTHSQNSAARTCVVDLAVSGNMTIDAGAGIDVTNKGYSANQGPGTGSGVRGASHGGRGAGTNAGPTYGSLKAPIDLGSSTVRLGGGAVRLDVAGTLLVNGTILANGENAYNQGGGSGGSIYLSAGALSGNGMIQANGGTDTGQAMHKYGNGAGGRIAIHCDTRDFSGSINACSGGGPPLKSAAGTIYMNVASKARGDLIIDNTNLVSDVFTEIPEGETWVLDSITLSRGGFAGVITNTTLDISSTVLIADGTGGIGQSGGLLSTLDTFTIADFEYRYINGTCSATDFVVGESGILSQYSTNMITIPGNILVLNSGVVTHAANYDAVIHTLNMTVMSNLTVDVGGLVDATAKGYAPTKGPGAPTGTGGGSYGGCGGGSSGPTYGSIVAPDAFGSGGAGSNPQPGGGMIRLDVRGSLTVDGTISANGGTSYNVPRGAGGSIHAKCKTLAGIGEIRADGGCERFGHGAGGGRIALYYDSKTYSGILSAAGGSSASLNGSAGTIYQLSPDFFYGNVVVDNTNMSSVKTTSLPPMTNATDSARDLGLTAWSLQNRAQLELTANTSVYLMNLKHTNVLMELAGWSLTVKGLTITNKEYARGVYTAGQLGPLVSDSVGGGSVVVSPPWPGTLLSTY